MLLSACQAGYVMKQGLRQWRLSANQVDVESPELTDTLSPEKQEKLKWVPRILEFARSELDLSPGDTYQTFLDTRGEPVSHVVTAAHPEALISFQWCFPFVGCVTYKGYFDPEDAEEEADRLRKKGWDVEVVQVGAYSTLGWFDDPILSTMLDSELPDLVETVIHETVHRTLYVPDQTKFNESLATHVAREGTRIFMQRHARAIRPDSRARYFAACEQIDQDEILLHRLKLDLDALYRSTLSSEEKRKRKKEIFRTARKARGHLHGYRFTAPASNAYVLASETYNDLVPRLAALQTKVGGHPRALMAYLKKILEKKGSLPEELR